MKPLDESIVEDAALTWFGELRYAVGHGPQVAPGEPAAGRDAFGEVVLVARLREALRRLLGPTAAPSTTRPGWWTSPTGGRTTGWR